MLFGCREGWPPAMGFGGGTCVLMVMRPSMVRPTTASSPTTIATAIGPATTTGSLVARVVAEAIVARSTVASMPTSMSAMPTASTTRVEAVASVMSPEPWIKT
jgi:hypothetical protein